MGHMICSNCHRGQSLELLPDAPAFVCESCLEVISIATCSLEAPRSPKPSSSNTLPSGHETYLLSSSSGQCSAAVHQLISCSSCTSMSFLSNSRIHKDSSSHSGLNVYSSSSPSLLSGHHTPHQYFPYEHSLSRRVQRLPPFSLTYKHSLSFNLGTPASVIKEHPASDSLTIGQSSLPSSSVDPCPSPESQTTSPSLPKGENTIHPPQPSSHGHKGKNPFLTLPHEPLVPIPTNGVHLYRHLSTPNPLQYSPLPVNSQGTKRAVVCGITYRNTPVELKGCLNDANCMKYMLTTKFHFPESSILMLTEEQRHPARQPTKVNIMNALQWLVQGCQSGDSLVFHFSGHGSQMKNLNGEELDGFDEILVPVDFRTAGPIIDDVINATIVRPLPTGVRLHAIVDACHSGTVLDLPFLYRCNGCGQFDWEDHRPSSGTWKGTAGGEVYSFSGCDDHQSVIDTSDLEGVTSTGEMTYCFIQAIERGHGNTYGSLLNAMRSAIHEAEHQAATSLVDMLLEGGSYSGSQTQEPQLTASNAFDVSKPFYL